jgi:hypothetical protein
MPIDFHATYAGYSNVQLLTIVLQKELYDEAAVQAAGDILKTRDVTEEDRATAEKVVLQQQHNEQRRIEQREELANRVSSSIWGILFPVGKPVTWFLKAFSVICFGLWIVHMIHAPYYSPDFFHDFGFWQLLMILTEVYFLVMLYWIFKINKKGWMLAMVYYIFQLGFKIDSFFTFYEMHWLFPRNESALVIQTVLVGVLLYYLNRKDVRIAFGVSGVLYRDILIVGCVLALFFIVVPHFT